MGVRILRDETTGQACLYCSTSGWAFGPVASDEPGMDADAQLAAFLASLPTDPREMADADLERAWRGWSRTKGQAQEPT